MASSSKSFALLILLTLLSSLQIRARDSQFFNKVPSNNNNNIPKQTKLPYGEPLSKQEQEPSFIPQTENSGYGLYGHESGQLPPTTKSNNGESGQKTYTKVSVPYKADSESEVPFDKDLPDNYNTVAYVTKPQGRSAASFMDTSYTTKSNNNNYYNGANSYNNQQAGFSGTRFNDRGYTTTNNNNDFYNDANNNHQAGFSSTRFNDRSYTNPNNNNYYNGDNKYYNNQQTGTSSNNYNAKNNFSYNNQKQGMSDTRFLENGKYFHDISAESKINEYNSNRGTYGNNGNTYGYNNAVDEFQNQDEFQDFQDENTP